jgi:hypothetical protein
MLVAQTKVSPQANEDEEVLPLWQREWFSFYVIESDTWEEVPRGVIHPRSKFSTRWQCLVLTSLVYICAYIPFETR